MTTQLYRVHTSVDDEYAIVDLKDGKNRLHDFIVLNKGDSRFLHFSKPVGVAQEGYNFKNIFTTDVIDTSIGIPLFSKKIFDLLNRRSVDDFLFYECSIMVDGKNADFYIPKVKRYINTVDYEKSQYDLMLDGSKRIKSLVFKNQFPEKFYAVRDIDYPAYLSFSEFFIELIKQNSINASYFPRP